MSPNLVVAGLLAAAYLIGAIPFGFIIARANGIDLFVVGSGNIGATNVGRILGRRFGILVFALDFFKGALPVASAAALSAVFGIETAIPIDLLRVGVGLTAFLGHLFPVYLGFRGGKGVATGAGTMFVLVPGPAAIALLVWLATVVSSRFVSLASLAAVAALCLSRILSVPSDGNSVILTAFCFLAAAIVIVKHRGNLARLRQGTENRLEAKPMIDFMQKALHLLALALWLGSSVFNAAAAIVIFRSFDQLAHAEPGDRTANFSINTGLDDDQRKQLGSALAGAAVGPLFPILFGMHAICGAIALITALGWWSAPGCANRWRVALIAMALACVAIGWPIAQKVADLRVDRLSADTALAAAAREQFGAWHMYSLILNMLMILFVFIATVLAARLPSRRD